MDIDNYIESQYRELKERNLLHIEFLDIYAKVENALLKEIFAALHRQFVYLFKTMNERLPTGDDTNHYWADPSRDLLFAIGMATGLFRSLKSSQHAFAIDKYHSQLFERCLSFLRKGGGSTLPPHMEKVVLYYKIPIFTVGLSHKVERKGGANTYQLALIGEGSYAQIFKFRDEYYNKDFALKRAKQGLTAKELERFKREFEEMRKLSSPYILEVYVYDDSKPEYVMECMDTSLDKYIQKSNTRLSPNSRKRICFQILRAFEYLHSKGLVHRDISPKNVLLKLYEDTVVVKISDFGLVKVPDSKLTSVNTEFKGYFNDPVLVTEGFDRYRTVHETYALTKLLFYVMTGKTNTSEISDSKLSAFVKKGLHPESEKRFQNIDELAKCFRSYCG